MSEATAKNEIQVVLQEYLGNKKAEKVAEMVYAVMQTETQHTHNGKMFFINEDSNGALVLTMESMLKEHVETILTQHLLEKDEVQECLERLMVGSISTEKERTTDVETISTEKERTTDIETISVEGSDSQIYLDMLKKYNPTADTEDTEKRFFKNLKVAIKEGVKTFKVPVCDPSIAEDGSLQFVAGCKPAVGYSYNELEELANKNGVWLGSKNQYILFMATTIHRLVEEGWSEVDAVYAVCNDSTELGHYCNSANAKGKFELTGSRNIVGKCDLANTFKVLAKDEDAVEDDEDEDAGGFWVAGGGYNCNGGFFPISDFYLDKNFSYHHHNGTGWFVL